MSEGSGADVLAYSKGLIGGLLGFCSAAVLTLVVVEARSTALTVALCCFAFALPLLGVQYLDFNRADRHLYHLGSMVANAWGVLLILVPYGGLCALVVHVSPLLGGLFFVWSVVCMTVFGLPFVWAQRDEEARAWYKPQPARTLYVTDPDQER